MEISKVGNKLDWQRFLLLSAKNWWTSVY